MPAGKLVHVHLGYFIPCSEHPDVCDRFKIGCRSEAIMLTTGHLDIGVARTFCLQHPHPLVYIVERRSISGKWHSIGHSYLDSQSTEEEPNNTGWKIDLFKGNLLKDGRKWWHVGSPILLKGSDWGYCFRFCGFGVLLSRFEHFVI